MQSLDFRYFTRKVFYSEELASAPPRDLNFLEHFSLIQDQWLCAKGETQIPFGNDKKNRIRRNYSYREDALVLTTVYQWCQIRRHRYPVCSGAGLSNNGACIWRTKAAAGFAEYSFQRPEGRNSARVSIQTARPWFHQESIRLSTGCGRLILTRISIFRPFLSAQTGHKSSEHLDRSCR